MRNPLSVLAKAICVVALAAISADAQSFPKIQLQQIFPKLDAKSPVWMCESPDGTGRFFVVAQDGIVYLLKKNSDGSDAKEFLNIVDRHVHFNREDGLLSIAFHPGYKTNGLIYAYYTVENKLGSKQPDDGALADKAIAAEYPDIKKLNNGLPVAFPYRSVISEFKVSANDPDKIDMTSERVIFEVLQPFWNHKGALLQFGPDGYLYFGLGDGGRGDDPFNNAQNTASFLGKMLRIDVNTRTTLAATTKRPRVLQYGIPNDNPFAKELDMGGIGAQHEIWAYGFRNPWRYSFDRKTGAMWVGDVGQDLWEEIDLVTKGGNYGWSVREGAHHFKPGPDGAKYIDPIIEYPHKPNLLSESTISNGGVGTSVTGGYVYRGKKFPSLDGIYIYADYTLGAIWGLRYDYDAHKVTAQGTLLEQKENITSFAEDNAGELYALMENGHIYQIVKK